MWQHTKEVGIAGGGCYVPHWTARWAMREVVGMAQSSTSEEIASDPVVCFAHRGARGHAPENTLLAFDLAFDLGADVVECDVRRSRDGHLVVIHDDTVDRTTNGRGLVAGKSLAELRALNAGASRRMRQGIPELEEVLKLVWLRGGGINLEIKGHSLEESIATAEAVEPILRALPEDRRPRVLVSSFEHPAVVHLKEQLSWLRLGALFGSEWKGQDLVAPAIALGAEAIHPDVSLLTEESVVEAHRAGLRVNVWTANSWARIRRLLQWRVDGIFSDLPERVVILRRLMCSRKGNLSRDVGLINGADR
jgi:glycerophosphoryl diester phosphodiesterase